MICSLLLEIQKRCSYLKNVALDFVLLVLKLYPIQVVISLPLWIKLTMGQLLLLFLCNFCSFFSYVGGVLVTNLFSLLLIDRYILAIQQITTHEEHLWCSFWSAAILICGAVLMYALYGHPRYFRFKQKYQQYSPRFQTIFPFLMTMQYITSLCC